MSLPGMISYTPPNIIMGRQAANLLSGLTPEEREEHRKTKERERNQRRQEKINMFRAIEYLPTNNSKIVALLQMFNPSLKALSQDELSARTKIFLDGLGLI
jgi:hypothetical protein